MTRPLYRYSWKHEHRPFVPEGMIVLELRAPRLKLTARIVRHQRGLHHWLRIRHDDDDFPVCMIAGPLRLIFAVIREFAEEERGKHEGTEAS